MKRIASIDVGSNTLRLLILETDGAGNFRELDADRAITRLGEGMDSHKRLLDRRIDATLEALARFRDKCKAFGDIPIHAVATSAVREASNQDEFLRRVYDKTGITLDVIPWEEEARLTLDGVFWKIPDTGDVSLTFDIGGGSTEFILSKGKKLLASAGTSLGIVRLTEKFISQHPAAEDEYRALEEFVRGELRAVRDRLAHEKPQFLIGTAGTVTTLAALDKNIYPYDPIKVHGSVLTRSRIQEILDGLKGKTLEERLLLKPLERGREDVIVAGICIVLETLDAFAVETLTVSEYSLR
ncbi:MAG: Ppx/GppA family phosphatase, partial [Nitrospinae bacterium]|nr:Ppx/GppA family phosphatase [Nitrospinota bacterium]